MPADSESEIQLEIGHVLLMDIVGYSKLLITEQRQRLQALNEIVRNTAQFRASDASRKLIRLPTGDGMALIFRDSLEAPVRCALEISQALRDHPQIQIRMGIHSGPVSEVADVNERTNVAGAGIDTAQRVMDCGDAGHILLSKHVADDLTPYPRWSRYLHDLGECEVKHGRKIFVVNLCTENAGNSELPEKFKQAQQEQLQFMERLRAILPPPDKFKQADQGQAALARVRSSSLIALRRAALFAAVVLVAAILAAGFWVFSRQTQRPSTKSSVSPALTSEASPAVPFIPEKSIAVLPFENLSEEKANAFFADGVQDEILTDLARIADLKVISRTSVMQYKSGAARNLRQIGKELWVANIVEGSVQRTGNRVRVNAQLIDARTDKQLWGQTYDRDLADVFAIQSEIATTIADQLQTKLSPSEKSAIERPPTSDITAFDLYTRANNLLLAAIFSSNARADFLQAIDLLNQAVARDPLFFQAYCQLAYAHDALYFLGFDHTPARLALAEAAIQGASRLRPDAGETHLARAYNLYQGYLDYDGALAELEVARHTLPNDPRVFQIRGFIERRQGRWEESARNLERAIELDPRNLFTLRQAALSYRALRSYAEEKLLFDRTLAFDPSDALTKVYQALLELDSTADTRPLHRTIDSIRATNGAAMASIIDFCLLCALAERDVAAAENALITSGENAFRVSRPGDNVNFNRSFVEGVIDRVTKDDEKARAAFTAARAEQEKIIQAQPNFGPALCVLGLIDAALGRKEEALREGRRAVELLSVEKDAYEGPAMVKYLAMIAAWVGDKDVACDQLAIAIRSPSGLSYGQLKLLPFWDPLRGDPRFEKLVEEAKKPVAVK